MDKQTREKLAAAYRSKSDEAFLAAQECCCNGRYRSSCTRAWYSIYQVVTAGAYLKLQQEPPKERDNWNHNVVEKLLNHLLRASHVRLRYGVLIECLPALRETRVLADYLPNDGKIGKADAEQAIAVAERIRRVVYEVVGW
jgi:uncharacterized protein (UPF0332 family)